MFIKSPPKLKIINILNKGCIKQLKGNIDTFNCDVCFLNVFSEINWTYSSDVYEYLHAFIFLRLSRLILPIIDTLIQVSRWA
jgi:hypothetical protein